MRVKCVHLHYSLFRQHCQYILYCRHTNWIYSIGDVATLRASDVEKDLCSNICMNEIYAKDTLSAMRQQNLVDIEIHEKLVKYHLTADMLTTQTLLRV